MSMDFSKWLHMCLTSSCCCTAQLAQWLPQFVGNPNATNPWAWCYYMHVDMGQFLHNPFPFMFDLHEPLSLGHDRLGSLSLKQSMCYVHMISYTSFAWSYPWHPILTFGYASQVNLWWIWQKTIKLLGQGNWQWTWLQHEHQWGHWGASGWSSNIVRFWHKGTTFQANASINVRKFHMASQSKMCEMEVWKKPPSIVRLGFLRPRFA